MALDDGIESARHDSQRLLGREHELVAAAAALTVGSRPAGVILDGEPGIGKTSVLRHLLGSAGTTTLHCRSAEAESALGFVAIGDLVLGAGADAHAGLAPPLRDALRATTVRHGVTDRPALRTVAAGVLQLIDAIATSGPLLIGIDDAQWLDPSSDATLRFVLRRLGDRPVGIVITVRNGEDAANPLGIHDALPDAVTRIALGPLTLGALHDLVHQRLGVRMPRPVALHVAEISGGNPFYALELARALVARDAIDDPGALAGLTDRLHRIVDHRILGLSHQARVLATLAAASSKPTVATLLEAMDATDWSACGGDEVEDAGILEIDDGVVRFTHPLLATAVLDNARPSQVRAAHRQLAEMITDPVARGRHLAAAALGPDDGIAAAVAAAAEDAWERGDRIAAAELSDRAAALTPARAVRLREDRRLRAAAFSFEAGNPARAHTHLRTVLADTPGPAARAAALVQLGSVRFHAAGFEATTSALEEAWTLVGADDHATRARIKIEQLFAGIVSGDVRAVRADVDTALTSARAADDQHLVRTAASIAALAGLVLGDGVDEALLEEALAGPDSGRPLDVSPALPIGAALVWTDHLDRARTVLTAQLERSAARGDYLQIPLLTWLLADTELRAGDLDAALHLAEETMDGTRIRGADLEVSVAHACRAKVLALRGELDRARVDAAEALTIGVRVGGIAAGYAVAATLLVETTAGDPRAVHAVGGPALAVARARQPAEPAFVRWLPDEVEALIALGELHAASDALDWYGELGRRTGRDWATASEQRCRAMLAAERGDDPEAERLAEDAVARAALAGLPFAHGRALLVAGGVHRRGRRKRRARERLLQACERFEAIGATPWVERVRDELARGGLGRPGGVAGSGGGLTEAEVRVAETVADGATNKEAAAQLFMSAKTIEHHLTRIYAKLDISSRRELPVALRRLRRPPGR